MKSEWREMPGVGLIRVKTPPPRHAAMLAQYRAGATLEAIGNEYGITRERVRQILSGYGIDRRHGGVSVQRAAKQAERDARTNARTMRSYGMSSAEWTAHKSEFGTALGSPFSRFKSQKGNARSRGIEWRMTFGEWWTIWRDSGKWAERGRGKGYVMARNGDAGPYAPSNVYICTATQNILDYYARAFPNNTARRGFVLKQYKVKSGHRWMVELLRVDGKRHFGGFTDRITAESFAAERVAA